MRLLCSGNYMTNKEQRISRIKLLLEEQHALIGKLKKVIRIFYKSNELDLIEAKSEFIFKINGILSSFKVNISEFYNYNLLFRLPSIKFENAVSFLRKTNNLELSRELADALRGVVYSKNLVNCSNLAFLMHVRKGKFIINPKQIDTTEKSIKLDILTTLAMKQNILKVNQKLRRVGEERFR